MPGTSSRQFLGTGWKFPLRVDERGRIATASEEQRIEESIYLILGTAPGERAMRPDFGCGIHDLNFVPNNPAMAALVVDRVRRALVQYEHRIDVMRVAAERPPEQPNLVLVRIDYRIRATNSTGNLVYPFYITEGT
jgi:phage baseplate assembly protein W